MRHRRLQERPEGRTSGYINPQREIGKLTSGAGEVSQWERLWMRKCEDPSSAPQTPYKSGVIVKIWAPLQKNGKGYR